MNTETTTPEAPKPDLDEVLSGWCRRQVERIKAGEVHPFEALDALKRSANLQYDLMNLRSPSHG